MKYSSEYNGKKFFIEVSSNKALNYIEENKAYYHSRNNCIITGPKAGGTSLQRKIAEIYGIKLDNRNILRGHVKEPFEGMIIDMTETTLRHALDR